MNYLLFKLRFTTAVHFGASDSALSLDTSDDHFRADTLFSALCHTALSVRGSRGVEQLCRQVQAGTLLLSDSMPWEKQRFFLPKPMKIVESNQKTDFRSKKAMKKLNWIPVDGMEQFSASLSGAREFDVTAYPNAFGVAAELIRAAHRGEEEPLLYPVGVYVFRKNCGLWFVAGYEQPQQSEHLKQLVTLLGLGGIGGKTSSGYGRFVVEEVLDLECPVDEQTRWLSNGLHSPHSSCSLLLTTSLPRDSELETALDGAFYQLIRRSGFVQSEQFSDTWRKKRTQMFIRAGATFAHRFEGDLYAVGMGGNHPVYRYGKPIFLGVNL